MKDDFSLLYTILIQNAGIYRGGDEALCRIEAKMEEAERIFKVLSRTGPLIPIQEAAAITAWLK